MDFFYDGQIRRFITQFMRIFIGFKYQAGDGTLKQVPVSYGDLSRQVANIIRENSENKMPSVPKISCYVTALELDTARLSDASFVSKINIRERDYGTVTDGNGNSVVEYNNAQGGGYTVERLMPTPYKMTVKADIWTSNTDQKLQILEQILVLFNPSLEVQFTDNYIDWTSLSTVMLNNVSFSSRTIPQGTEQDIDVCSLDFEMPVYISPPAKVKKLGVVKSIVMNVMNSDGSLKTLNDIVYNSDEPNIGGKSLVLSPDRFKVLLLSSLAVTGVDTGQYYLSIVDPTEITEGGLINIPVHSGEKLNWEIILQRDPGYQAGISQIRFLQQTGYEIVGTFTINELDPTYLVVNFFADTLPTNDSDIPYVTGIINPQTFNPLSFWDGKANIPTGTRYLILEDIGSEINVDGADAWKGTSNQDLVANANDIIEWNGNRWIVIFASADDPNIRYLQNLKTKIQYKWDGVQWLRSFEGEYQSGFWRMVLEP